MTSQWRHRHKTHSWYSKLNPLQNIYFDILKFWKLTEWCHFVTYLRNDPRLSVFCFLYVCLEHCDISGDFFDVCGITSVTVTRIPLVILLLFVCFSKRPHRSRKSPTVSRDVPFAWHEALTAAGPAKADGTDLAVELSSSRDDAASLFQTCAIDLTLIGDGTGRESIEIAATEALFVRIIAESVYVICTALHLSLSAIPCLKKLCIFVSVRTSRQIVTVNV